MNPVSHDADNKGTISMGTLKVLKSFAILGAMLLIVLAGLRICEPTEKTVEKTFSQSNLAKIALKARVWHVRRDAVEKLTDQVVLARIAMEDKSPDVREVAIRKLTNETLLDKLAFEDKDSRIRDTALVKLAVDAKEASVRLAAAKILPNQATLARVASASIDTVVGKMAVENLTSSYELANVAVRAKNPEIGDAALAKLPENERQTLTFKAIEYLNHDQMQLAKLVLRKDGYLSSRAMQLLTDHALLADVAIGAESAGIRTSAAEKLTDQALLKTMGMWVIPKFTKEVSDQTLLKRIVLEAKDVEVRLSAFERVTDKTFLAQIKESPDFSLRRIAFSLDAVQACQLTPDQNQGRLYEEVLNLFAGLSDPLVSKEIGDFDIQTEWDSFSKEYDVFTSSGIATGGRATVIGEKITVCVRLKKITKNLVYTWMSSLPHQMKEARMIKADIFLEDIFGDACNHLSIPTLSKVACESRLWEFRIAAVKKLTDQTLLAKIAVEDESSNVRKAAEDKLQAL